MSTQTLAAGTLPTQDSDDGLLAFGDQWFPILDASTWAGRTTVKVDTPFGTETLTYEDGESLTVKNVFPLDRRPIEAFGGVRK